jgi:hypothetical protein
MATRAANDRRTVGRADVDVADVEEAGRDLLDTSARPGLRA